MKKMRFQRKDANKKLRIGSSWRRPKGLHNKRRLQKSGHAKIVKPGFKKAVGLGKETVSVSNTKDLQDLNPKKHELNILKVSKKKKLEIISEAKKKGFGFVNFNPDRYEENTKKQAELAKELKKKKESREKKESEKKPDEKDKEDKKSTEAKTKKNDESTKKAEGKDDEVAKKKKEQEELKKKTEKEVEKILTKK